MEKILQKTRLILIFICFLFGKQLFSQPKNGLHFDGIDDRVYIGNSPLFNTGHLTVQAWVKIDYLGGWTWRGVVTKRNCCGGDLEQWTMQTTTGGLMDFFGYAEGSDFGIQDPNPVPIGIWTNFTGTYDGHVAKLYKNGLLVAEDTTGEGNIIAKEWPVVIGDRDGGLDWFPGAIDEVRIWDRALDETEIQNNINCALTGKEVGLVAYYNFNQGIAGGNNSNVNTLFDQSPNHLDGTLQNFLLSGGTSNWISNSIAIPSCPILAFIRDKSIPEGNIGTKQLKFPVTLNSASADTIKIKYKTFDNTAKRSSDYVMTQGTLIFKPGQTQRNIIVTINSDTQPEANESFYVKIGLPENVTIADDTAVGVITDDDAVLFTSSNIDAKLKKGHAMKIFPNPVKNKITIAGIPGGVVKIVNTHGQTILQQKINFDPETVDVSKLKPGTYRVIYFNGENNESLNFLKE